MTGSMALTCPVPLCRLLETQKAENGGAWPETVAVVLWGTDNIKTYGESLAQVRLECTRWSPTPGPRPALVHPHPGLAGADWKWSAWPGARP